MSHDPNSMFQELMNAVGGTNTKTASETSSTAPASPFEKGFFAKLTGQDAGAIEKMASYIEKRANEGLTTEEIGEEVASFEAADVDGTTQDPGTGGGGDDVPGTGTETPPADPADPDDDEFETAKVAAELRGMDKAIADEIENNPLAKELGIDQEKIAQFLLAEAEGESYMRSRTVANEIIEKIASEVFPSEEVVEGALVFLKQAGINTDSLEAQIKEAEKTASVATETAAQAMVREKAEEEAAVVDAIETLSAAGFDVEKVASDAEGKKKMSGKAKAALAVGGAAALAGGAAMAHKRGFGTAFMNRVKKSAPSA